MIIQENSESITMPLGEALGALIFGLVSVYLGILLYSSLRKNKPYIEIWWLPRDMEGRESIRRFIIGIGALSFALVGSFMLIIGMLVLLKGIKSSM